MENAHGLISRGKENDLKLNIGDDLAQDLYRIENFGNKPKMLFYGSRDNR